MCKLTDKTFATDYYAVLLIIGIVWGIAFWEEKVLEEQKKKLNHLYLNVNKGVISEEL